MTLPFMFGWIEHKYSWSPAVAKVKEKLASLARVFDRNPLFESTTVCGMASLLTQVTVVPGTTVISPGMKVLWSMLTVATGPAPALLASWARQGIDARVANRTVSLKARRTLCDLQRDPPKKVSGFAAKCVESRTIKTNLLVWVEAICPKRIDIAIP